MKATVTTEQTNIEMKPLVMKCRTYTYMNDVRDFFVTNRVDCLIITQKV